ncbi:MAG TPA: hypothetical protein VGH27_10035 [Streptosporangiaceae bacterium]
MITSTVAQAALGGQPSALAESVSLATPLTMSRITGRPHAVGVLRQLAAAFNVSEPEFVTQDDERAVVTFAGHAEGHDVGLLAILTPGPDGRYQAVDLYARPWPFVAMARDKLAAGDDLYRDDIDLSVPYVPSGPTVGYLPAPPAPPALAADVKFHSPVLTETAAGRDLVTQVLQAVEAVSGTPRYRFATLTGSDLVVAYDASVHGHTWQLAAVFGLNDGGELSDLRIYSRPWPVTALFRGEVYKLLRDVLGPSFWQGQPPLAALSEAE